MLGILAKTKVGGGLCSQSPSETKEKEDVQYAREKQIFVVSLNSLVEVAQQISRKRSNKEEKSRTPEEQRGDIEKESEVCGGGKTKKKTCVTFN